MAKDNDWKSRLEVVYSTNPDFNYMTDEEPEEETLPKQQQKLRVQIEKNHRGGKRQQSFVDLSEQKKTSRR